MAKTVRMIRTQTGKAGTFHAGGLYPVTSHNGESLAKYVKRGFAEELTAKEVAALSAPAKAAAKAKAEAEAKAGDASDGKAG